MTEAYDALLLVSFGGPEGPDEVEPFLDNVLAGRNVPPDRRQQVSHHYYMFGGISPINEQNRQLIESLKKELELNGPHLPIYWGNRNWHPMLEDTVRQMQTDGIKRALAFVTSAYSSYSSCRQYLENISAARKAVGEAAPSIEKLRPFYNHPGFIEANSNHVQEALNRFPERLRSEVPIAFTAHSVPSSMAETSDYVQQLTEACSLVMSHLGPNPWKLVYQSRSGPPTQPWLEPNICDHLRQLHALGHQAVVVSPLGFISDHMEVKFDLDTEAKLLAEELGMQFERAQSAGVHPRFVQMIRELILERTEGAVPLALGSQGVRAVPCQEQSCHAPRYPAPAKHADQENRR